VLFRAISAVMALFFGWAAAMQLNDPDPARWFALYISVAPLAALSAAARPFPRMARLLGVVALVWAAAIAPELLDGWRVQDLGATMSAAHPKVEYGREFVGLLILAAYCFAAARLSVARIARATATAPK
jgi:hypothetical protein